MFAQEEEIPAAKRLSVASSSSSSSSRISSSADCGADSSVAKEELLLRFPGFAENDAGRECLSCYQVTNITVNFVCEVNMQ